VMSLPKPRGEAYQIQPFRGGPRWHPSPLVVQVRLRTSGLVVAQCGKSAAATPGQMPRHVERSASSAPTMGSTSEGICDG
jgi:hypothetical protein